MGSTAKRSPFPRWGVIVAWIPGSILGVLLLMGCQGLAIGFGDPDDPFRRSGGDALALSTSYENEGPSLAHGRVSAIPTLREQQPARPDWNVPWKLPLPQEMEPDQRIKPFEGEPGERDEPPENLLETGALSPEDVAWCRLLVTLVFENDESPSEPADAPNTRVLPVATDLARD